MILILFTAKLFPIALPPIVSAAIVAVVINPTGSIGIFVILLINAVIVTPAEPETTPHISPITSQQKEDTFSSFFLNLTAILAAFTRLEFI